MPFAGVAICLTSAAAFGAMGVFGKLAFAEGASVATLLSARFVMAAAALWVALVATGGLRGVVRRDVVKALVLGAIGYGAQAGAFFAALERMDASLLSLLLYTYPVFVTAGAIALGRAVASPRAAAALVLAGSGLVLVLATAGTGALDPLGSFLGLASAAVYTVYILSSEGIAHRVAPLTLTALVCTGAAVTLTAAGAITGGLDAGAVSLAGYGWLSAIALVSTVGAVLAFFAGVRRVGPSSASILFTLEPVVTVGLAAIVFGEALGPAQVAGGALVLAGVLAVRPSGDRDVLVEVDVLDRVQECDALVHRPLEGLAA